MKRVLTSALVLLFASGAAADIPSAETQIAQAVLAAPEEERDASTVLGYDDSGALVTLREGTNGLVCLADDPTNDSFSVACYSKGLDPYMQRGRDLRAEGKGFKERFDTREIEVKDGSLALPDKSILYVLTGELNVETGEVENTYTRFVIYIPFSTPDSTGIPLKPSVPGGPWMMNPGTHNAHIMINPARAD